MTRRGEEGADMILDCALFAGEQKMLELRMRTLADVVDRFVAVACGLTHQGEPADRVGIVAAFGNAVCAAGVTGRASLQWVEPQPLPAGERGGVGTAFYQRIEREHRDGMRAAALEHRQSDEDSLVLLSDVDEIPSPDAVERAALWDRPVVFEQRFHSTALRWLVPQQPWLGTCAARLSSLYDAGPQALRDVRGPMFEQGASIAYGGWHLSWLGTDSDRRRKLDTFSHAELRQNDPAEWRAHAVHADGQQLIPCDFSGAIDWPAPLCDGTFTIPEEWQ